MLIHAPIMWFLTLTSCISNQFPFIFNVETLHKWFVLVSNSSPILFDCTAGIVRAPSQDPSEKQMWSPASMFCLCVWERIIKRAREREKKGKRLKENEKKWDWNRSESWGCLLRKHRRPLGCPSSCHIGLRGPLEKTNPGLRKTFQSTFDPEQMTSWLKESHKHQQRWCQKDRWG